MTAGTDKCRIRDWRGYLAHVCLGLLAAGLGCGHQPSAPQRADVPPPGTMMTVSVTPIEAAQAPNLIRNGDFSRWQANASAPDYFGAPDATRAASIIEPERDEQGAVQAVRQTWMGSDSVDAYSRLFHTWVTHLRPDTRYRFSLRVHNESPNVILVRALEYPVRTPAEALVSEGSHQILGGVSFGPTKNFEEFSFEFQTGGATEFCVLIGAKHNAAEGVFPAVCVWDEWSIRPVAPDQTSRS